VSHVAALITTDHLVAFADAESAVAVNPAAGPAADPLPRSVARDVIRLDPAPTDVIRRACSAGSVQLVVADDFWAQ
jgi:hypothetical protein